MIGVLALQGNFERHVRRLEELGAQVCLLKERHQLAALKGIVLPGGESTTLLKLADSPFREAIKDAVRSGLPTLATCAGLILIAKQVSNPAQESLELLDVDVARNAYGRQVDSFIAPDLHWTTAGERMLSDAAERAQSEKLRGVLEGAAKRTIEGVFIRAPKISRVGASVQTLIERAGDPVLVQSGSILAATFHPEQSANAVEVHGAFLSLTK